MGPRTLGPAEIARVMRSDNHLDGSRLKATVEAEPPRGPERAARNVFTRGVAGQRERAQRSPDRWRAPSLTAFFSARSSRSRAMLEACDLLDRARERRLRVTTLGDARELYSSVIALEPGGCQCLTSVCRAPAVARARAGLLRFSGSPSCSDSAFPRRSAAPRARRDGSARAPLPCHCSRRDR